MRVSEGYSGATRGGVVSKSATKAPRAGIGRGGNRGISTILFRRSGSIRAFVADLDTDRVRTGSGPGPTGPTRPAHPICLRFRFSPPLPEPNMAPREDRSGAHPTARPSEPRNHAETDGHTRGGARTILPGRQNRVRALGPARPRPRRGAPVQQIRTHPAPQAPYAPLRHTQNNLPGRLFRRRLSVLCDVDHWGWVCGAAGPVVMVPGPCRPGP